MSCNEVEGKTLIEERTVDPEVFQDMDNFELNDAGRFALSVRLQFPKFSKGFTASDFENFIETHIGEENVVSLGRLSFPNEWQMQVKSKDIREKLIRIGRTKINTRTCWIAPLSQAEVRGFVHWLPTAINHSKVEDILTPFGELLFMETLKQSKFNKVDSDSRYFAINLKPGQTMDDIPHFINVDGHSGLITIKGRNPSCFHCKELGHRKTECKKYREKLSDYCLRDPNPWQFRRKPRGRRYQPSKAKESEAADSAKPDTLDAKKKNAGNPLVAVEKKIVKKKNKGSGPSEPIATPDLSVAPEILKNIDVLKELSSILSQTAISWNNKIEGVTQKLLSPIEVSNKIVTDAPIENSDPKPDEKKKKKKKKKKKNVGEVAIETKPVSVK